jgi:hypothetical protein
MDDWEADSPKSRGLSRLGVSGCASGVFTLGGLLVCVGLITGWVVWHMPQPDMDIGPPPGAFGFLLFLISAFLGLALFLTWLLVDKPSERAIAIVVTLSVGALAVGLLLDSAPWVVKTYAAPEIVGVVSASEARPDGIVHVELEGGRSLDVMQSRWVPGEPSPSPLFQPMPYNEDIGTGDLLLAANQPSPWYAVAVYYPAGSLLRGPDPCYFLQAEGTERQDSADLDFGIRLPKAPGYESSSSALGAAFKGELCLDIQGRVRYIVPIDY